MLRIIYIREPLSLYSGLELEIIDLSLAHIVYLFYASFQSNLKLRVKNVQVLFLFVQTCMVIKVTLAMLRRVKF